MRRLILVLGIVVAGIVALVAWSPSMRDSFVTATFVARVNPEDLTLLPPFTPAYPCELQNVEARIEQEPVCRSESIKETILAQSDDERLQFAHDQCRMRFPCGVKIRINAEMNFHGLIFKPGAAAHCEFGRLGDFGDSKKSGIKEPRGIFAARGHCQLNVIDSFNSHRFD